jgi:LysM repeat protein
MEKGGFVMPAPCPGGQYYVIRQGDTFYSLARRFGLTVEDLQRANPGVDPNNQEIGQVICIPGVKPPVTCPAGTKPYIVQAGDTYYSLARKFNTTVEAITAANPGVNPNNLQIGQTICIPGPTPVTCPMGTKPYIVQAGDTYYNLARKFNTTVEAITAANPGVNPNNLQIGQTICIPGPMPPTTCPMGTKPYVVQAGDTYYSLARRFNTTVDAITKANPGVNPNNLQVGQTICIPQS